MATTLHPLCAWYLRGDWGTRNVSLTWSSRNSSNSIA